LPEPEPSPMRQRPPFPEWLADVRPKCQMPNPSIRIV
jgi:hypothetical protein